MYRIGNLRALAEALIETVERDGNEAEHYFGIELVNLARREGMTEEQIIEAVGKARP